MKNLYMFHGLFLNTMKIKKLLYRAFYDKINKTWLDHLFSLLFEKALRKPPGAADKDGQNVTLPDIFPGVQWLNLPLTTEVSLWLSSQLLNESILFNYLGQSVLMSYNNISCFLWKLSTLKRKEHTVNVKSGREWFLNSYWAFNCYFFFDLEHCIMLTGLCSSIAQEPLHLMFDLWQLGILSFCIEIICWTRWISP